MDARRGAGLLLAAALMLGLTACQTPRSGSAEPRPSPLPVVAQVAVADPLPASGATNPGCPWTAVILSATGIRQVCRTW
jgi:hypothetical protein